MSADKAIRRATALVVGAVAAFAAVVSYTHIYDLGRAHGQSGAAARLLPLSVDGLILAASLVLLDAARRHARAPLAQAMLWLGITATLGANAAYGSAYGLLGVLVSAWPAVAFIGSAEMLFVMIRSRAVPAAAVVAPETADSSPEPAPPAVPAPAVPEVPMGSLEAAKVAYAASVRGGNPLSERQLADRFGITRPAAKRLRTEVATAPNGHRELEPV